MAPPGFIVRCFEPRSDPATSREPRRALLYALQGSAFQLAAQPQGSMRRNAAKNRSDCMRSPIVWAATRAASSG